MCKNLKQRRANLYKENPNCPDCGVLMILPDDLPRNKKGNIPNRDNLCTFEHVHSRWHFLRGKGKNKNIILCSKCNNKRARRDNKLIPHELKSTKPSECEFRLTYE